MLLLTATTDKLQLVTGSAADIDVHASGMDHTLSTDNFEGWRQNTAITTAATTDIVAAPASGVTRNVKTLHIRNKDSADSTNVTVAFDQNATDFELHKVTLAPGEALEYIEGVGFFALKKAVSCLDSMLVTTADVTNATTSFADITGLTIAVLADTTYAFQACLRYDTNATTTGARFGANGPAAPTAFWIGQITASTPGIASSNIASAVETAYDTAIALSTTGPGTTDSIAFLGGILVPSVSGTFALRFASEVAVANALIVRRGSWLRVRGADNT